MLKGFTHSGSRGGGANLNGLRSAFALLDDVGEKSARRMRSVFERDFEAIRHSFGSLRNSLLSDLHAIDLRAANSARDFQRNFNAFASVSRQEIRTTEAAASSGMRLNRQMFTEGERMRREGVRSAAQVAREQQQLSRETVRTVTQNEQLKATAAARAGREQIQTAALVAKEQERVAREAARTAAEQEKLAAAAARAVGAADRERIRTASLVAREYQKQEREKLKTTTATARAAAKEYERELGASFFSRLGSSATSAFKRSFGVTGKVDGGGGSFIGNALSVATGNLITGAISGAVDKVQEGISAGMDFNRLREATRLGLRKKLGGEREAEQFFNSVANFAVDDSPLKIPQATAQANRLLALNFKPDEIIPLLRAAGDVAAGLGLVGEEAEQKVVSITKALADIRGKQRVNAEELSRQLQEAGVSGWRYIAEELQSQYPKLSKLSEEQAVAFARDLAEHNRLDANAAVAAIVRGMQREFGGMGREINLNTLAGQENMTEDLMSVTLGQATAGLFKHKLVGQKALNQGLQSGGAERLAGYISAGTDSALSAVEDGLRSLGVSLPKLGAEAGGSYATGFKSSAAEAYGAGAAVGGAAEQGVRDRLEQHSPSKVLLNLGHDAGLSFTQGFANGLKSGRNIPRAEIDSIVREAAARFKVPPELIHAVIKKESSYHAKAVSPMGARGLMQLMPATAASLGVSDSFDPRQNVMGGTRYLARLLKMFGGDVRLALAAYNAGEGAVLANLPNRPDVNSYVGGSGRRWTVSEEAAQRAQGIPRNGQTPEYVKTIMRDYLRATGGAGSPVPVTVQNLPAFKAPDFSKFPGTPYAPEMERRTLGSDVPASGDLTGGVGRFAGPGNQRAFLEWLYAVERAASASERTSVVAQSEYNQRVSLMAKELEVSQNFVRLAQSHVASVIESERQLAASRGAADGGSFRPDSQFANITPEQAQEALRLATRSTGELKQEVGALAQRVAPQALASVKLMAGETRDAFQEVLPLVKESTEEAEKYAKKISGVLANYFGGALHAALRRDWRSFFDGLRDDALNFITTLAKDRIQKKLFEILSPKQSVSADGLTSGEGGGFSLKRLFGFGGDSSGSGANLGGAVSGGRSGGFMGAVKGLFGLGSSGASAASAASGVGATGAGSWTSATAASALFGGGGAAAGAGAGAGASGGATAGAGAGGGFGSLVPLLTNPWTIAAVGAGVAAFMLWNHFRNGTEKALQKEIRREYQVDFKNDWKALGQIKAIGEAQFGKGQVSKHLLETVRLDAAKELISAYAEQTGQNASKLVTNRQLADPTHAANNFVARREFGGPVMGGLPYLVGERRTEVFVPDTPGHIVPSVAEFMRGGGRGPLGQVLKRAMDKMRAHLAEQAAPPSSNAPARGGGGGGASTAAAIASLTETVAALAAKIKSMRPGDVVAAGAEENPEAIGRANNTALKSGSLRQEQQERLGMRNS